MAARKIQTRVTVRQNTRLNHRHFVLTLKSEETLPKILPGQFVQVLVEDSPKTFLRRPFSVHETNARAKTFNLLIQIKGEGSAHLSALRKGDILDVILPLGNPFSLPESGRILLVGGGCGVAPLLFLAQSLNRKGIRPDILVGFRSKDDIFEREEYEKFGNLKIITDDGSEGEKGIVTDHSLFQKEKLEYDRIYCCGPDPMMKSVSGIAAMHGIECEVSLENLMACGFGVCLCCVTPTETGNERVCVEGPVFNAKHLRW